MTDDITIEFQGLDEVSKTLLSLPAAMRRKVIMPALRSGAKVVRDQAEANVRSVANKGYATGELEKNISVYNFKKYKGSYRVAIMVKRNAINKTKIVNGKPVRIGLYASVLEYGKDGQQPRSWIRKAIREKVRETVNAVTRYIAQNINTAVQQSKKK